MFPSCSLDLPLSTEHSPFPLVYFHVFKVNVSLVMMLSPGNTFLHRASLPAALSPCLSTITLVVLTHTSLWSLAAVAVLWESWACWGRGNSLQEASSPHVRSFPERSLIRIISMKVSYTRMALGEPQGFGICLGFWEMHEEELRIIHQLGIEGWKWGKSRP